MKHQIATLLAIAAFAPVYAASEDNCRTASHQEVKGWFQNWNASLKTLDPQKVAANYHSDAVLLPTVANQPHATPAEINNYFVHFLMKKPHGVINKSIVKTGCNYALDVGTYTFTVHNPAGKAAKVKARYTFLYEFKDSKWAISHHHSSAFPEADEDEDEHNAV